ncbi:hypothetical protein GO011_14640 [Mycobacterium sp. 20091114027_K0903767]|nr:hypothetical protein [Mycobacterium sp. 20091114027_K0903767]
MIDYRPACTEPLSDPVATYCETCYAHPGDGCHTRRGQSRAPHASRLNACIEANVRWRGLTADNQCLASPLLVAPWPEGDTSCALTVSCPACGRVHTHGINLREADHHRPWARYAHCAYRHLGELHRTYVLTADDITAAVTVARASRSLSYRPSIPVPYNPVARPNYTLDWTQETTP